MINFEVLRIHLLEIEMNLPQLDHSVINFRGPLGCMPKYRYAAPGIHRVPEIGYYTSGGGKGAGGIHIRLRTYNASFR